jgi:PAS domain S-box-containing protein
MTGNAPSTTPSTETTLLSKFARFLLNNHLETFTREIVNISFEMNIPLLNYFSSYTREQIVQISIKGTEEWLLHLAEGRKNEHIELTLQRWIKDQLPQVERDEVVVKDITLVAHTRKLSFLNFVPFFTKDIRETLDLVKEIDAYLMDYVASLINTFVNLLEQRITERQRKIEESEALYKQAQSITHIGNYVWDLVKNRLTWSDELYRIYELTPGESDISNETIAQYNHPDDVALVHQHISQSKQQLQPFDFHYRIVFPDGRIKILHARGETLGDSQGNATTMLGTAQDVTERQTLISQLQQSERLYKQAQALAHIGNWEWNVSQNRISWTDELFRIFGLTPQSMEIIFENYITMIHPEDRELVIRETNRAIQHKIPNEFFHRVLWSNGSVRIVHAKSEVLVNDKGEVIKLFGTAQDVTVQKLTEKKLTENQTFIQKIADSTPSIIASYNINTGKYVFINEGLKKLLGYEPQRALEEGVAFFIQLVHPDDLAQIMEKNAEALKAANETHPGNGTHEAIAEFQYRMKHINGEYRWFHTFGTVFDRNKDNQVEHVLNISLDITERIKIEQALEQRTIELQQSNANLEEFAFVASHDLKEPLRKISTFSDRLLRSQRESITPDGLMYLEKIMASSIRMQQMISDLLSLSMISGDKGATHCSLQKLWDDVVISFEHKIDETKAVLTVQPLPEAFVVPSQFRQLFQNLLSNSLKFIQPGIEPEISVSTDSLDAKDIPRYNLRDSKKYLRIIIKDNGIGFDNAYVEKIFAIFQRLHQKETYEGTGIGLAICKKIVENHGGAIHASGAPGQGATFTVIIPE